MFKPEHAKAAMAKKGSAWSDLSIDYRAPTNRLKAICSRLGLLCLDPISEFSKFPVETLYIPEDDHLSEAGHSIVASLLAKHISSQKRP